MPPGTLVSYQVEVDPVADFRGGFDSRHWSPNWALLNCKWRALWFDQRVEPPSWALADEVIGAGGKGVLFRSTIRPDGVNLVLHVEFLSNADRIKTHDPSGVLPKNQKSWS
jgi:RES domain-containing protein